MTPDFVQDIERKAKAKRLSIAEVCRRADIAPSTFQRWKTGERLPNLRLLRKVESAIANADVSDGEAA